MSDLNIVFPVGERISVNGKGVILKPVRLRDFELFGDVATFVLEYLSKADTDSLIQLSKRRRQLNRILRRATSLSLISIWLLPSSVAAVLFIHLLKVNSDFFGQAVAAANRQLAGL